MKCLILAAGYATRLYPLTENFPKPLLKVGEKTILDWLTDDIAASGEVSEFIIISNHKFVSFFCDWAKTKPYKITVLDDKTESNETRLGAVKDIAFAMDEVKIDDDILVIAGDNVLDFSLNKFISYAKEKNASCVMRYYEPSHEKLLKCGVISLGKDDIVEEMTEKSPTPKTHWCCPPFYFYKKEDAKKIDEAIKCGCNTDAPGSFASWLCKNGTVYAMEMPGKRYDIGNLESYNTIGNNYKGITVC